MKDLIESNNQILHKPTKRQKKFIEYWLNPTSSTYGNAFQSAVQAGYSDKSARVITGNARNLQWVQEAKKLLVADLQPEHIYLGIQHLAETSRQERDRLRAYELMAKIKGMFIERSQSEVSVTFTNSVPRPVIDAEVVDTGVNKKPQA